MVRGSWEAEGPPRWSCCSRGAAERGWGGAAGTACRTPAFPVPEDTAAVRGRAGFAKHRFQRLCHFSVGPSTQPHPPGQGGVPSPQHSSCSLLCGASPKTLPRTLCSICIHFSWLCGQGSRMVGLVTPLYCPSSSPKLLFETRGSPLPAVPLLSFLWPPAGTCLLPPAGGCQGPAGAGS